MGTSFPLERLGDYCLKIGSGATPKGGKEVYIDEGEIALIRSQNVYNNQFVVDGLAYITSEAAQKLDSVTVEENDVLLNITGDSVARCCSVPSQVLPARVNQHVAIIRPKPGELHPLFIRYFLVSPNQQDRMLKLAGSGATRNALTKGMIEAFSVPKPSIEVQRSIVKILGDLDDKIDLLREMNGALEGIARAIFRAWFVDFEPVHAKAAGATSFRGMPQDLFDSLPVQFQQSKIGEIPNSWTTESLIEQADWINGAAYKDMHFSKEPDALPVVKIAELKKGIGAKTQFTNTDLGSRYRITTGELMFSWSGSPETSIDAFIWALGNGWLNQHIFAVRPNGKKNSGYLFALLKYLKPKLIEIAKNKQTTGLGHVTREDMARLQVCEPSEPLLTWFSAYAQGIYDRILSNLVEVEALTTLRDTLLPKLISGELEAPSSKSLGLKAIYDGG
jgi:type I restriction enzyme S subunit